MTEWMTNEWNLKYSQLACVDGVEDFSLPSTEVDRSESKTIIIKASLWQKHIFLLHYMLKDFLFYLFLVNAMLRQLNHQPEMGTEYMRITIHRKKGITCAALLCALIYSINLTTRVSHHHVTSAVNFRLIVYAKSLKELSLVSQWNRLTKKWKLTFLIQTDHWLFKCI